MPEAVIYADGQAAGTLRWRQEGLYTLFEGELPGLTGLRRLYLFGGGRRCCLGIMEPRSEGLLLRRRYSRMEAKRLPAPIAYAATEPQARPMPPAGACFLRVDGRRYLALPCALRADRPGLRLYRWAERNYLLFRWE